MAPNVLTFPSKFPHRGLVPARLKDARIAASLNQTELATAVDVSRQAISAFEAGEKNPEPATMQRIADVLNQPISFFSSQDADTFGEFGTRYFRAFGADTKRRNLMSDVLSKWFVQVARYLFDLVSFPDSNLPNASPRNGNRYADEEIEEIAEECRRKWGLGTGPISNVIGLLENNGVVVCRYEMTGQKVEAFSFWNGPRPFVFLSSEKQSAVRARFDAAHELGHLVLHRWLGSEEIEDPKALKLIEAEANRFAGALLLPRVSFPNEVYSPRLDAFVDLKRRWKVAISAMVYRCKNLGIFDDVQVTNLYKQISFRKWRTSEPLDDQIKFEEPKLLRKAIEIIVQSERKMRDEIASDLRISRRFIAAFCGLPPEYFEQRSSSEFVPMLK